MILTLKELYQTYVETRKTSDDFNWAYEKLTEGKNNFGCDEIYDILADLCYAERETAFKEGFRTAVHLLMGGNCNE